MHNTLSLLTCLSFNFGLPHSFAKSLLYIGHRLYLRTISDSFFLFLHIGQTRSHLTLHLIRLSAIYTSSYTLYYLTLLNNTCVMFLDTWCNPVSSYRRSQRLRKCVAAVAIEFLIHIFIIYITCPCVLLPPLHVPFVCYVTLRIIHCNLYMIISAFTLLHFSFPPFIFQLPFHR